MLRKPKRRPTPVELGELEAVRARRAAAEQLRRGLPRGAREPRPGRLRLADPQPGRLRRLRARHHRPARLDDRRRPPLQRPPAAAAAEHDAGRSTPRRSPTSPRSPACAAQELRALGRLPHPDAPPARRAGLHAGSPGTRRSTSPPTRIARVEPDRLGFYLTSRGTVERDLLRRAEGGARARHELDRQRRPRLPLAEHVRAEGGARGRGDDLLVHATGSAPT